MTIQEIVRRGSGRAGHSGSWRVELSNADHMAQALPDGREPWPVYELWHYGTRMLVWLETHRGEISVLDHDIGHGSVSDQNGMNQAFKALGVDLYYSRKGGAQILYCHPNTRIPIERV